MRAYKKFVENIAGLFDLTSDEKDLASLEMRVRQHINAHEALKRQDPDRANEERLLELAGDMSVTRAVAVLEENGKLKERLLVLSEMESEAVRCRQQTEARNRALEEQHVEYREKLARFEKYRGEEHGYALELLEGMKEELLQQANKQVAFLTQLVDGVVDDNKELLTKLGAAGDKDALKRILDNQQSDLFEKVARAKALLGRPLEMEEEAPEEQRLLDINKDGPIITEDMYKFFTGGQ